jgi:hemolysin type calcium-binding protein/WD40 repeat protein/predicted actin-binding protein
MPMRRLLVLLAAASAALALLGAAQGAFPGTNGLISFTCGLSVCQSLADGSSAGVLISSGTDAVWSPDGSKIAFSRSGDIWTANADGTNEALFVSGATNPAWAPNGTTIAYVKTSDSHIYERAGSTETQLTSGPGIDGDPAFSPNGTKLVYERANGGSYDLFVLTIGGSTATLVSSSADDVTASWSPDGTSLVFDEGTTLFRVPAAGGTATSLGITGFDPSYSPDGTKISYSSNGNLAVADATGANAHTVNSTLSAADTDWGRAQPSTGGGSGNGPRNVAYPTITLATGDSGPVVGHLLVANIGSWTGTFPITYAFQWKRCDAGDPVNGTCANISGATFATYTPAPSDSGFRLRVAVTATDSTGHTEQNSEVTAPAVTLAPKGTATPPILPGGSPMVDQTLSVATGTWAGSLPIVFAYSWRRCNPVGDLESCVPIVGATTSTYVPTVADIGISLRVWITGTNSAGSDTLITNHTFPIIDKPHFSPSVVLAPSIAGVALPKRQLTADIGTFKGDLPIATSFQWNRCDAIGENCHVISGATKVVYFPGAADVGFTLRITVTASNAYGQMLTQSDPTAAVAATPPNVKGRRIVGTARGDYLPGGGHDDTILGLGGNDTINGGAGDDRIDGGPGNDVITGGAGADHIHAGPGSDTVNAADGERDVIDCGAGSDHAIVDSVDVVHNCELVTVVSSQPPLPSPPSQPSPPSPR